ncbi:hypothetical protein [Thalassovita taeanensis]|uniref:Uncharacterized protein n=1 Tax=Thalassovita taeanensis TaxID=657014 RepID=A0A1H8ZCU4_9RHOB|nr:hypothetical protein [Thalassovita taeanensis]SEP61987.1 hypothetical protein SAMN04488092_101386 [Thalassovita taeanensis]
MGLTHIASRLIKKHGQAATLLRPGEGTVDEYGGYTPGPDTGYPVTLLSATYAIELQLLAGGFLDVGDQRVLLSVEGLTVVPQTTDKLLIDGIEFETRRVAPLAPADAVIFWEMQVRNV